jgi:signal transduction histidine kinase
MQRWSYARYDLGYTVRGGRGESSENSLRRESDCRLIAGMLLGAPCLALPPGRLRAAASRARGRWSWGRALFHVASFLAASAVAGADIPASEDVDPPGGNVLGLPFTRFYSFDEIGNAARGARLGFDHLGRIGVTSAGSFSVLNDTTWLDLADKEVEGPPMQRLFHMPDGMTYYVSYGSWGVVETTARGLLRPRPEVPADRPKWVASTNFNEVVSTRDGVFFGSFNGVVYWDRTSGRHTYIELKQANHIFALGEAVYATSYTKGIQLLDVATASARTVVENPSEGARVDQLTVLGPDRALICTIDGRLLLFDGQRYSPWPGPLGTKPVSRVTAIQRLPDGHVAVAFSGRGLYLVSTEGKILSAYTTPEFHRIVDLAAREPGVLWIATETGIEKVLYESPLTLFGQRVGLPISWPQIVRWRDRIVVASGGRLYETAIKAASATDSLPETQRFHLLPEQPAEEIWGLAAQGDQLLIGTSSGIWMRKPDGAFVSVLTGINVTRLVMTADDLCYVIGGVETAVLRREGERWSECAPRAAGVRYPSVAHAAGGSAWVELGADGVARVSLRDGQLRVQLFDKFPWGSSRWVNVGVVGDTVILRAMPDGCLFYDERTEAFVEAPALRRLVEQAPRPLTRLRQDEKGVIWGTHDAGLLMFPPGGKTKFVSFGRINERFPILQLLPGGDVWLAAAQSLYHVNPRFGYETPPPIKPTLVSMVDGRTQRDLLADRTLRHPTQLAYAENNVVLHFFAGTYATRRPPAYEFRLHRNGSEWNPLGNGSLLSLTDLREGHYRLEARASDGTENRGHALVVEFEIAAPWYRTWYAYLLYGLGVAAVVIGLVRWSVHHTRSHNLALEKLVNERTEALRLAMQQLNEETRHAATLAERDRLAGEIHDSLQQGLSGLMLHLDATLKLADLPADVRSRLTLARNMVSFTRHEVQHAVWDMETPLLEDTELGDALRKLAALIGPGTAHLEVTVTGSPVTLSPATKHHLLRIAQEAIANAVRHAAAATIDVTLMYEARDVMLTVKDDGNGFVPGDVLTKGLGHFGLRGLRGRAAKIGGELQIDSAPGRGTVISVRVRLPAPAFTHAD